MNRISILASVLISLASGAMARSELVKFDTPSDVVRIEFVFDNNVRRTSDLPTAQLRATRRQMISGGYVRFAELRALADAGDGLAAFRFARLLEERETPDPTGSKAHYYAIAAYTGRDFAVGPLARLLKDEGETYSASRLNHTLNAMTVQALSGNPVAATLLGEMYLEGVPFGRDLAQAQAYLQLAADGGDPSAILQLGVALMSDPADAAAGHAGARSALTKAAAGDDLSVRVTSENLLRLLDKSSDPNLEVME